MATLTPSQARVNLSALLRRALQGDDIGIVIAGKVVALRPTEVLSSDYAEREYGLAPVVPIKINPKQLLGYEGRPP